SIAHLFSGIDDRFAGVKDLASTPRGLIRMTAPTALGRQYIAPGLSGFLQAHPEIRIELELTDRLVNLAQEGFDLAIRHSGEAPETHVAWVLCNTRTYLVSSPSYLERSGAPQHPSELAKHRCIQYLRGVASQNWAFARAGARRTS